MTGQKSWNPKIGNVPVSPVRQRRVEAADNRHVYRFNSADEWVSTIKAIRAEYVARRSGRHLDIICRHEVGREVILHFDMKNVYLIGFTVNGQAYEFGITSKEGAHKVAHKIPGSIILGYDSGYIDLGFSQSLSGLGIGHVSLCHALNVLVNRGRFNDDQINNWINDTKKHMATILVMLPESVRFKWHFVKIERIMSDLQQQVVTEWMSTGIRNWDFASRIAIGRVRSTDEEPPGADHEYTVDDMVIALEDHVWASDLVVISSLVPRCVLKKQKRLDGEQFVTHVLVQWTNLEENWQTEERMNRDFPAFNTKVTPTTKLHKHHQQGAFNS